MSSNNLFKQIWKNNFKKLEKPQKLADDMGPMRGIVHIKEYDPATGLIIKDHGQHNSLVNQSKSNLIRLISQGQSPWLGAIDPTQLKISKMRFGNNNPTDDLSPLLYYDISEPTYRGNIPIDPGGTGPHYPGGNSGQDAITYEANSLVSNKIDSSNGQLIGTNIYAFNILGANNELLTTNPPAHDTLCVTLYVGSAPGTVRERIWFYDPTGSAEFMTYPRAALKPYKVETYSAGNVESDAIVATGGASWASRVPNPDPLLADWYQFFFLPATTSSTYLYYDYVTSCWRLQLENLASRTYTYVQFDYKRGTKNVINSIVPRLGNNKGLGTTLTSRYTNSSAGDYYPILSSLEYRDCDTSFIDDYSVTFSVNMSGQYGNGDITDPTHFIQYTEAFLFNERDDMFSALFLTTPFAKNAQSAFYISWTILAPL